MVSTGGCLRCRMACWSFLEPANVSGKSTAARDEGTIFILSSRSRRRIVILAGSRECMDTSTLLSRLQFAFTISFHYLFPQLTMGLALLLLILRTLYLWRKDERYNTGAHFWARIFAVTFIVGVVTGIPMEFQFGINWARFSVYVGDIIAQTLAMEGVFAFFIESTFLGIFLFGEHVFGQKVHWFSAFMVWLGTWASGGFIIASNAWMQHLDYGRLFVTLGVMVALLASGSQLFPSGDLEGVQVTTYQPAKLAAMEGLFQTQKGAGIVIIGQPDPALGTLDNAIIVPDGLSFLTYRRCLAQVRGR